MRCGGAIRLVRVARTVADLATAMAFYRDALDFRVVGELLSEDDDLGRLTGVAGIHASSAVMRLGCQQIELVAFDPPGKPYPLARSAADPWFQHIAVVVSDIGTAYARLCEYKFEAISVGGPQQLPASSGSVIAFKFRDPDGHPVELIQFPKTKESAWSGRQTGDFLGVDHSAICVTDLQRSIDFYARLLDFVVASRSVNDGPAQERLDGVPHAIVDVIALQPQNPTAPHVELLGYRSRAGPPAPLRADANDAVSDRLIVQVEGLQQVLRRLRDENADLVSAGSVALRGGRHCALVRDPSGHLLQLCDMNGSAGSSRNTARTVPL